MTIRGIDHIVSGVESGRMIKRRGYNDHIPAWTRQYIPTQDLASYIEHIELLKRPKAS